MSDYRDVVMYRFLIEIGKGPEKVTNGVRAFDKRGDRHTRLLTRDIKFARIYGHRLRGYGAHVYAVDTG